MGDGKRKASGSELAQDWNFRFFDNHSFLSYLRTDNIIVLEVTAILVTLKNNYHDRISRKSNATSRVRTSVCLFVYTHPLNVLTELAIACPLSAFTTPSSGKSGPKDQVALHYYYTSPSHWCTTHEVSKL